MDQSTFVSYTHTGTLAFQHAKVWVMYVDKPAERSSAAYEDSRTVKHLDDILHVPLPSPPPPPPKQSNDGRTDRWR